MTHNSGAATDTTITQDQPESHHSILQSRSRRRSDVLEATELSRIRSNYSRSTGSYHRAQVSTAPASPTKLWRWKHAIYKFWKNQISIVVPYETCRDHLGRSAATISLTYYHFFRIAYRFVQGLQSRYAEAMFRKPPNAASPAFLYYLSLILNGVSMVFDGLALERTFLAYLRTSLAISMIGITVAQLFRLQHSPNPSPIFGYYVLGKPLSCICQGTAIYSTLLGAYRSWRLQNAIVRGKAIAGGIEVSLMGIGVLVMCIMFFVLLIAVDINKED